MIFSSAPRAPIQEDRDMSSKQKGQGNEGRGIAKEKGIRVAADSQQTRPPGSRQSGSAEVLSANKEAQAATLRNRSAQQGQFGGSEQAERGSGMSQQTGWSARQQAQRMQSRAEEARKGESQQSGYGGMEQDQPGGSKESRMGSSGSMQSGGAGQLDVSLPSAAPAGPESKRGGSGKH
jgi:hypothetical protein